MRNARLAIDLRYAAGPLSGFGRFTWTLIEGLAETGPPEPILLIRRRSQAVPDALAGTPGFAWKVVERAPYEPLGQWRLARELAQDGIRVMVSPDCFAPLAGPLEQVITVHDIIPLRCPELLPRSAKGRYAGLWRRWLHLQMSRAAKVLTVSDHARHDIADVFPGAAQKLATVYNAVPICAPSSHRRPASGAGPGRLLYVGRDAPYKNIIGCVETLAALRRSGVEATLTIVGEPDPRYPEVGEAIRRLGLEDRVIVTGHVDEATLEQHYRDASVFLFLSRYEGFGLPPLEAMAQGVPVVSSGSSSLPEVLGDAALLVDPDDVGAAADAVRRILDDPVLAGDLASRGRARAAMFTVRRQATMFWAAIAPLL